jgi:hypothetical protein
MLYLNRAPKSELIITDWTKAPIFLQIIKGKSELDAIFSILPDKLKEKMKYYGQDVMDPKANNSNKACLERVMKSVAP